MFKKDPSLRSHEVVDGMDKGGPRAHLRNVGLLKEELKKPFIAIVNTYNEMHPGHFHLNELVGHIRDGVYAAGGVPFAFGTIAICDGFAQANIGMCYTLPSREVIADSVEVMIEGHRYDGMVLVGGCDKIVPALLMAAARLDIPAIVVTGGPMMPGRYRGQELPTYHTKETAGKVERGLPAIRHVAQVAVGGSKRHGIQARHRSRRVAGRCPCQRQQHDQQPCSSDAENNGAPSGLMRASGRRHRAGVRE